MAVLRRSASGRQNAADAVVNELAHAADDDAAAVCVRGALEDGLDEPLVPLLRAYVAARDSEIESLCERHYSEFLNSVRVPPPRRAPGVPRVNHSGSARGVSRARAGRLVPLS